jgi:excinuclease ABC subunit B
MRPTTDLQRRVAPFEVVSDFEPAGDQPQAISDLTKRIRAGEQDTVLLGATGTGKSATTAWLIEQVQRPTLVMAPNKTLAAQLANEFRELLPNNAVEYFVSYYDYYQPEAYVPQTDTYIEKDSSINDEVERLRHSATNSLLTRRDVIVVASVSCIYGLGTPQEYVDRMVRLRVGDEVPRDDLLRKFVQMQYTRNDLAFTRGTFRVRGDTVEIIPMYEELAVRIEFFGDEVEAIYTLHPLTGEVVREESEMYVFPASHYVAGPERMERAIAGIESELEQQLALFERQGKLLEAQRLRMRTTYDIEMMRQVGSCSGIENYSMHIDGRLPGTAPNCLLDYFPEDFLLVIDESHVTVPQIGAMYEGDASRKRTLVDHGFRLPSAMDNRPLKWEEFLERIGQTVYLSATPGAYELTKATGVVEQIIRPTGLIDPEIILKPTKGQIDDLSTRSASARKDERVLVTTLTKMARTSPTTSTRGVRVRYLHSTSASFAGRAARAALGDTTCRRHQPPPRGSRPARGLSRRDPRRRQGGLPALQPQPHPDDRARGSQRLRPGAHVRRQGDPVDGRGGGGDHPAPGEADRLQPRARDRPPAVAQEDRRHHRHAGP